MKAQAFYCVVWVRVWKEWVKNVMSWDVLAAFIRIRSELVPNGNRNSTVDIVSRLREECQRNRRSIPGWSKIFFKCFRPALGSTYSVGTGVCFRVNQTTGPWNWPFCLHLVLRLSCTFTVHTLGCHGMIIKYGDSFTLFFVLVPNYRHKLLL